MSQLGATVGASTKPDNFLEAINLLKDGLSTGDNIGDAVNKAKEKLKGIGIKVIYCEYCKTNNKTDKNGEVTRDTTNEPATDTIKFHPY